MDNKTTKGALLLAFGGADSIESVEPFIRNVLKGRPLTQELIDKTRERYGLIGGSSPLLSITEAQAKAVAGILDREGAGYKVYVGMRYWHPFIKDTIKNMRADGIKEAVAVIMAPFSSRVATGGYLTDVTDALKDSGMKIDYARDWHREELFIDAVVENLKKELDTFKSPDDALVIFSNHSLPVAALVGDPYVQKITETAGDIAKKLHIDHRISYQSQGAGPREWLGPKTEEVIDEAKRLGKKGVVVVPLGFVADHVETLYDIDILFKEAAARNGIVFKRSASLNTSPKFMELVASLIKNKTDKNG
jgi:protoporphyrin/coproporphyrin ferrochelatase